MPAPRSSYLVAATQRSGSTMLCRALRDTGLAGRPEEYFLCGPPETIPEGWRIWEHGIFADGHGDLDREQYLDLVFRLGTTPNGIFGAKLMWNHIPCMLEHLRELPRFAKLDRDETFHALFPGLRIVRLVRRDRVRQAVSWARAAQDGIWVVSDTERPAPTAAPAYDFELIRALEGLLLDGERGWPVLAAELGVTPLTLHYEDLVDPTRYEPAIRAVLEHLGVGRPDTVIPAPRTHRQADDVNEEWVQRYRADLARSHVPAGDEPS